MAKHTLTDDMYDCFIKTITTPGIEHKLKMTKAKLYSLRKPERQTDGAILQVLYKVNKLTFNDEPTAAAK